jgi:hypothetical protein
MSSPPNLSFTRFVFLVPRQEDDVFLGRLRHAGGAIVRGFFNDFEADGARETPTQETMQFFVADEDVHPDSVMAAARYVVQITGKYRPRLRDVENDLRRRIGDAASLMSLEGAERPPRYTSPELHDYAYRRAAARRTGRQAACVRILPVSKSAEWWARPALERHAFFYPHIDAATGCPAPGHARAAEAGIPTLYRRLFHNPDGYERQGEYDFLTYFECDHGHVGTFDEVLRALRDTTKNPEWRYVREGPLWKGRRVLKW